MAKNVILTRKKYDLNYVNCYINDIRKTAVTGHKYANMQIFKNKKINISLSYFIVDKKNKSFN